MRLAHRSLAALLTLTLASPAFAQDPAPAGGPKVGDMAPDFTLPASTQAGTNPTPIRLSELRGQVVVIAFFPKSRTRGCTVQMENYRDQYAQLFNSGNGVTVLAVSTDDVQAQQSWAADAKLTVTFVSDPAGAAGNAYDVKYPAINMYRRVLFVIDKQGKIAHIMRPFRELSGDAYTELGEAVKKALANN